MGTEVTSCFEGATPSIHLGVAVATTEQEADRDFSPTPIKEAEKSAETTPEEGTIGATEIEIVYAETVYVRKTLPVMHILPELKEFYPSVIVNQLMGLIWAGDSSSGYRDSETQPTLSWETPALQKQLGEDHTRSMGVGSHTGLQSTLQSTALSDIPTKSFNSPSSRGSSHAAGDWEYARKACNRRKHTQWARFPVNNLPGSQERWIEVRNL